MQSMADRQQTPRNITESYNPRYRKGDFGHLLLNKRNRSQPPQVHHESRQPLQEGIMGTFGQLQGYINGLQTLFSTRMEVHEEQIIQIAHSQIKKIQAEAEGIIRKYSQLIKQRNISNELLDLKYEVRYYQLRACEMFEENKKLRVEIKTLKDEIQGLKMGQESAHEALTNVSKKYLREKTIRKKLQHTQLQPLPELLSNSKLSQLIKQNPEDGSKLGSTTTPHRQKPLSQTKPHLNFFSETLKNRESSVVKVRFVRDDRKQRLKTEPARQLFPLI